MKCSISTRPSDSVDAVRIGDNGEVWAGVPGVDFKPRKFHPLLYHLPKVQWAVFGSLTWKDASRRHDSDKAGWLRKHDVRGVLHRSCSAVGLRDRDVGIYHATEFGGSEQCHVHCLVAREGLRHVSPEEFAGVFGQQWREEFRPVSANGNAYAVKGGVGLAVVMPYDQAKGYRGVAYCLKREFDGSGQERERHDYMSHKLINLIQQGS